MAFSVEEIVLRCFGGIHLKGQDKQRIIGNQDKFVGVFEDRSRVVWEQGCEQFFADLQVDSFGMSGIELASAQGNLIHEPSTLYPQFIKCLKLILLAISILNHPNERGILGHLEFDKGLSAAKRKIRYGDILRVSDRCILRRNRSEFLKKQLDLVLLAKGRSSDSPRSAL